MVEQILRDIAFVSFNRPCQLHEQIHASQSDFGPEGVFGGCLWPSCKDLEQVTLDDVCFGEQTGDIESVELVVEVTQPVADVFEGGK